MGSASQQQKNGFYRVAQIESDTFRKIPLGRFGGIESQKVKKLYEFYAVQRFGRQAMVFGRLGFP